MIMNKGFYPQKFPKDLFSTVRHGADGLSCPGIGDAVQSDLSGTPAAGSDIDLQLLIRSCRDIYD